MVFSPARRRPVVIASPAPSDDTGNRLIAAASPPSATMLPGVCRVSVRAQTEVPAIAALTAKPWRARARTRVCNNAASPTEQMRAAGDIKEQPVRRIERHQRREAVAPIGDIAERLRIGHDIGVEHLQVRAHRSRIRQGLADMQAEPLGDLIQRMDHQRVVVLDDDDAGLIGFTQPDAAEEPLDPIDGQARQPQAENAPTVH